MKEYDAMPKDMQKTYIGGMAEGIAFSFELSKILGQANDVFCLPTGVALGRNLAEVALDTEKNSSEEPLDMHLAVAIVLGLIKMFPCD